MCIDDKGISHEGHTIMSNYNTGKIALLIESTKKEELEAALDLFGANKLKKIRSINSDMDVVYLSVCEEKMPYAEQVIDKFHVMKYVYDAIGSVLQRVKKKLQSQLTQGSKKTEEDKILLQWIGKTNRCWHTIVQSSEKWSERRKEIINEVFTHFSELQIAYQLGQDFKQWYNRETQAKDRFTIQNRLHEWYKKAEEANIEELTSVVKMIQKHQYKIINYFKKGLPMQRQND